MSHVKFDCVVEMRVTFVQLYCSLVLRSRSLFTLFLMPFFLFFAGKKCIGVCRACREVFMFVPIISCSHRCRAMKSHFYTVLKVHIATNRYLIECRTTPKLLPYRGICVHPYSFVSKCRLFCWNCFVKGYRHSGRYVIIAKHVGRNSFRAITQSAVLTGNLAVQFRFRSSITQRWRKVKIGTLHPALI